MAVKIIYALACVLECVFVPLFLKYSWPEKCWTSFKLKMVCSALFITTGVCCIFWAGNGMTEYAKWMLIGLIFGMLGDLFLHLITDKMVVFGVGLFSFLIGHIFFIKGFGDAIEYYFPQAKVFDWRAIIAVILVFAALVVYAIKAKMEFGIALVPVIMYAITILFMFATALQLCFRLYIEGYANDIGTICTVGLGALLFVASDLTLALILFSNKEKKMKENRPIKIFNILTYFAGQILLGTSILYVVA